MSLPNENQSDTEDERYEDVKPKILERPPESMRRIDLSNKLREYTILGLEPGEKYKIELLTKTGSVPTRQKISDIILTRPKPPKAVQIKSITSNSCIVSWTLPEGHPCLRGFQVQMRLPDGKILKDFAKMKTAKSHTFDDLMPCQDYDIAVIACCMGNNRRTLSEVTWVSFTTLPEPVRNLRVENSSPNSLTITWDAPLVSSNLKYKITIDGDTEEDDVTMLLEGNQDNVSQARSRLSSYSAPSLRTDHTFQNIQVINFSNKKDCFCIFYCIKTFLLGL